MSASVFDDRFTKTVPFWSMAVCLDFRKARRTNRKHGHASSRDLPTFLKPSPMTPEYAAFVEHKLRVYKPPGSARGVRRGLAFV